MTSQSTLADVVAANQEYAAQFTGGGQPAPPQRNVAVVTCMDTRIDVLSSLGLAVGDAHIIRNAGGVVTDDVIRSLTLSQRALGTREVLVIHHTKCGVEGADEAQFRADLQAAVGVKPQWSLEAFGDAYDDVRQSMARLRLSPFLAHKDQIHGFVYDVDEGRLHPVTDEPTIED